MEYIIKPLIDQARERWSDVSEYMTRLGAYETLKDTLLNAVQNTIGRTIYAQTSEDNFGANFDWGKVRDAIDSAALTTLALTAFVSDDAGEMAMESIQESFSNAVQYSIGGQISCVAAFRCGCMPPQDLIDGQGEDSFDVRTRALMDAMAGIHVHHTIAREVARRKRLIDAFYAKMRLYDDLLELKMFVEQPNVAMMASLRDVARTAIQRLVDDVRTLLWTLLRRVNDILLDVRVAKAEHDSNLMSDEEYQLTLLDAWLELQEIENEMNAIMDDLRSALSPMYADQDAAQNVDAMIDVIESLVGDAIDAYVNDFDKYIETLMNARKFVKLRNVRFDVTNEITGGRKTYDAQSG